jgi:polar amino acid transport system substrate-binding protein
MRLICRSILFTTALAFAAPGVAQAQTMSFVMENFPPFIVDDRAQGAGPFPEVVRAVCDAMKVPCSLRVLPWRRAFSMAEAGAVDGIFVLARTAEREKTFYFTDPVFQSSFVVIAREPGFTYDLPKDLDGKTIATYGPSAVSKEMHDLSKSLPRIRLEMEIDNRLVLRKLRAGRYPEPAAAVMNREVGLELIDEEKLTGLKIVGEYKPVAYGIGLSRKKVSKAQAERFNDALRELIRNGTVKAIAHEAGHLMRKAALCDALDDFPANHPSRCQCITQFSFQLLPPSRETAWYQRHDCAVIWSHTPRTMTAVLPSISSASQVPTPSRKLPHTGAAPSTPLWLFIQ